MGFQIIIENVDGNIRYSSTDGKIPEDLKDVGSNWRIWENTGYPLKTILIESVIDPKGNEFKKGKSKKDYGGQLLANSILGIYAGSLKGLLDSPDKVELKEHERDSGLYVENDRGDANKKENRDTKGNGRFLKGNPERDDWTFDGDKDISFYQADAGHFNYFNWAGFCLKEFGKSGEKFVLSCEYRTDQAQKAKKVIEDNQENSGVAPELVSKNTILYGPPGTGKTYNSIDYALACIEGTSVKEIRKKYDPNKRNEETDSKVNPENEGDKPAGAEQPDGDKSEETQNSVKNSGKSTKRPAKDEFDKLREPLVKPDVWNHSFDPVAQIEFVTFHQSYGYEDFIEGIRPKLDGGRLSYELFDGIFKRVCKTAEIFKDKNFVLIIDEINRGNISKIFGELITLIEDSKRIGEPEELKAVLPLSGERFGVPKNVYILGTMNTADRSIALLDTALRRRFDFIEMPPNPEVLDPDVGGVNLKKMLTAINEEIDDKNHKIGHAFFTAVKTMDDLTNVFNKKIIPLLEEYFFDDEEEINKVLSCEDKYIECAWEKDDFKRIYGEKSEGDTPEESRDTGNANADESQD